MIRGLKRSLYRGMMKIGLICPKVILQIDGGVCSQMHQYLLGWLYAEKGYIVRYDLSFFEEWGSDLNRSFVRNFDLQKAFPYLHLQKASKTAIGVYRRKYYYGGNNSGVKIEDFSFLHFSSPVYLGGYYHLPSELWLKTFHSLFKMVPEVLDNRNKEVYTDIKSRSCSVAVHVRRGDLTVEVYAYGKPASLDYFQSSVLFFQQKSQCPYFYFFSDEPEWVEQELISKLPLTNDYKVVDINGSDKGYMDLYLIAYCKHQITSKGTLGKYGALLNDNPQKFVVLCNDKTEYAWKDLLHNPIFL